MREPVGGPHVYRLAVRQLASPERSDALYTGTALPCFGGVKKSSPHRCRVFRTTVRRNSRMNAGATRGGRSGSVSAREAKPSAAPTERRGRRSAAERRARAATGGATRSRIATPEHTALVARERSGGQQPGRVAERSEAPRVPGPGPAPCMG